MHSKKRKTQRLIFPFFIMRKIIVILAVIAVIVSGVFWWNHSLSPVNQQNKTETMFVIRQGSGIKAIAADLKKSGLIRNSLTFTLFVKQSGLDKKIQAGDFRLSPSLSAKQIAIILTQGSEDIWVTIPEGKRAEEVAVILEDKIATYDDTWLVELKTHEGYLFPDTYLIPRDATLTTVVNTLTDTFALRYKSVTNATNLTREQIVILASLIEREARHDEDRPLISSVIHNRLEIGMALQIDATVQYALGFDSNEQKWWKKNLTYGDLRINSLYNTYLRTGLPPTPIANPGLKALQAAANPANTNYLYYITDKNGINHYATTLDQHNANIRKYGL